MTSCSRGLKATFVFFFIKEEKERKKVFLQLPVSSRPGFSIGGFVLSRRGAVQLKAKNK